MINFEKNKGCEPDYLAFVICILLEIHKSQLEFYIVTLDDKSEHISLIGSIYKSEIKNKLLIILNK